MSFSRNWIGHVISQGERFVVQYLDRAFGGRIRQVFEVTPEGVDVTGDLDVSGGLTVRDGDAVSAFSTDVVDLLTATTYNVNMPLVAGKKFICTAPARIQLVSLNADVTVGLTYAISQNGAALPLVAGQTVSTGFANFARINGYGSMVGTAANWPIPDMTSFPLQLSITTPFSGAGVTTCTGRLIIPGYYQ